MCYSIFVQQDLEYLTKNFGAKILDSEFKAYEASSEIDPKKFKPLKENSRIYPGYYAPVILSEKNERLTIPMRYRVRPEGSKEEVPSKYNLFNARLDSLTTRKTWKTIFMRNHGILVYDRFFEWVSDKKTGKKKVVSFKADSHEVMWSPVLYDTWTSGDLDEPEVLRSFAVITTDPPKEILENGHDRCPIFLKKDLIDQWLNPQGRTKEELIKVLSTQERAYYQCYDAVP